MTNIATADIITRLNIIMFLTCPILTYEYINNTKFSMIAQGLS